MKPIIRDTEAENQLLAPITPTETQRLEDAVYELADKFFRNRADKIEEENTIVDVNGNLADYEHSDGSEKIWYDDARDECMRIAYAHLKKMFKAE